MRPVVSALAFALTLASIAPAFAGAADSLDGWETVSEGDGITVYKKLLNDGDIIAVRGAALIPARLDDIAAVMKDNKTAADWMPMIAERRDLKQLTPNSRLEYTHLAMPWPVTDRYYVNLAQADQLPNGALRFFVKSVDDPDKAYLEDDKVLGFLHVSEFILTPVDGGAGTEIKLEVKTDPRGLIPKVLVNLGQKRWPRQFFEGLIDQLKMRGQYAAKASPLAH